MGSVKSKSIATKIQTGKQWKELSAPEPIQLKRKSDRMQSKVAEHSCFISIQAKV